MNKQSNPPRTFRLAAGIGDPGPVLDLLAEQGFGVKPLDFADFAFAARGGNIPLGKSLAHEFGLIYIQDRSSMLPPLVLNPPSGSAVLDMCASPGGKTGILARLVGYSGLAAANEPTPDRYATLRQNLRRENTVNAVTMRYPGRDLPLRQDSCPHILLDPPCSGWGTADKHPWVMDLWREDKVAPLIALQKDLLAKAARLLAPGGRLVYSTCTTNRAENEDQVLWAAENLGLDLLPFDLPGGAGHSPSGMLGVGGDQQEGQGFFMALLTKPGQSRPEASGKQAGLPGKKLGRESLEKTPGAAWDNLPPGEVYDFSGRAVFVPGKAREFLPPGLTWQGPVLGRVSKGRINPDPRMRVLLPPFSPQTGLNASADELLNLVAGQSLSRAGKSKWVGLYYRGLALGRLTVKGARLLWSGR